MQPVRANLYFERQLHLSHLSFSENGGKTSGSGDICVILSTAAFALHKIIRLPFLSCINMCSQFQLIRFTFWTRFLEEYNISLAATEIPP